jgi:hypothetical protein
VFGPEYVYKAFRTRRTNRDRFPESVPRENL